MHLQAAVCHPGEQPGGIELGHGNLAGDIQAGFLHSDNVISELPQAFGFGLPVRQAVAQYLPGNQGFAKYNAFTDVFDGHGHHFLGGNIRHGNGREAFMLKLLHLINKAFALLADQIFDGYPEVVKKQFSRIAAAHSQFVQFAADSKTLQIRGYNDQAEGMVARIVAGAGQKG